MAITKRLRFEILRRDGFRCRYCGTVAADVELHVDHVVPSSLGGSDDPDNLVAACVDCNGGKASSGPDDSIVVDVSEKALRWKDAMLAAFEELRQERTAEPLAAEEFLKKWRLWSHGAQKEYVPIPEDFDSSVSNWLRAGMPAEDIYGLIPIAMKSKATVQNKWPYFCGVVWRTIERASERALELSK